MPSAVFADIKQEFVTSAQITVDMPFVTTQKIGTTYSLRGNNITPSETVGDSTTSGKIGGINIGSLTAVVYSAITTPEYTPYTGEVYFLENRKPIQRAPSQEEEIKLVIQF